MTGKVLEARGSDVEAAIKSGLARLGVGRDAVEIEVLDQGSKGLLGIGARDAVVRLTAPEAETPPVEKPAPKPVEKPVEKPAAPPVVAPKVTAEPAQVKTAVSTPTPALDVDEEEELAAEQTAAIEVVATLLEKWALTPKSPPPSPSRTMSPANA